MAEDGTGGDTVGIVMGDDLDILLLSDPVSDIGCDSLK
jgi:hypothetical protein